VTPPTVLLLGKDHILADTRLLILEKMGYRALKTEGTGEAKRLAEMEPIDLLILCHTVPDGERLDVLRAAKARNPAMRCLWLLDFFGNRIPDGTTGFCMIEGPARFTERVRALSPADAA
jgi:DNA-binding NtrC family response regulator